MLNPDMLLVVKRRSRHRSSGRSIWRVLLLIDEPGLPGRQLLLVQNVARS